jgi:riboflavin kinase
MVATKRQLLGKQGDRWFDYAEVLVSLVEFGGLHGYVKISGSSLGSLLGISQQAASIRLARAHEAGFIEKRATTMGYEYTLSKKAREQVEKFIKIYTSPFLDGEKVRATVVSGVGEGKFFLELQGYKRQIEKIYGFKPYPGTLNLKADQNALALFRRYPAKIVNGFRAGGKVFGLVLSYGAKVHHGKESVECVVVFPEITRYGDEMIECIAPFSIRRKLNLKDADSVYVEPLSGTPGQ